MKDQRQRIALFPALRQRRREMKIRILRDQSVEDQLVDMLRLPIRPNARIEIGRAALNQKHDRIWIALRRMTTESGTGTLISDYL